MTHKLPSFVACPLVLPGAHMGPIGAEHSSIASQPNPAPVSVQATGRELLLNPKEPMWSHGPLSRSRYPRRGLSSKKQEDLYGPFSSATGSVTQQAWMGHLVLMGLQPG